MPIGEPFCQCCGRPFPAIVTEHTGAQLPLCRLCRENTFAFDRARSFGVYDTALHNAILLMKYEELTRLGRLVRGTAGGIDRADPDVFRVDVVVPVPLHPARQRERGYNQAELIARPLAKRLGVKPALVLLIRTKAAAGAIGAFAQGTLGIRTWRVRYAKGRELTSYECCW